MTKTREEAFKHCFAHITAAGVVTLMTKEEVLNTYTDSMCKDLEDCGITAKKEEVAGYIGKEYEALKDLRQRGTLEGLRF